MSRLIFAHKFSSQCEARNEDHINLLVIYIYIYIREKRGGDIITNFQ
jgi:hypothetical protein